MDFTQRSLEKELMDEQSFSDLEWMHMLDDLAWVNRYLMGIRRSTTEIKALYAGSPITVADFACGGGTNLIAIAKWAKHQKIAAKFFGYDINPALIEYTQNQKIQNIPISFEREDIFSPGFSEKTFDIVMCNFFCHHLTNDELVNFIHQMYQQAKCGVIINDLHRHWLAYIGFNIVSFLRKFHPVMRADGLTSVKKGFIKQELIDLLNQAGIKNYKITWCFPFHYKILIDKDQ